jgi:hypothetical protein
MQLWKPTPRKLSFSHGDHAVHPRRCRQAAFGCWRRCVPPCSRSPRTGGYSDRTLSIFTRFRRCWACPESRPKTSWDDVLSLYLRLAKRTGSRNGSIRSGIAPYRLASSRNDWHFQDHSCSPHSIRVCAILNSRTLLGPLTLLARSFIRALSTFMVHQNDGASSLCWILG